jgi:hypothetical protein
VFAQGAPGTAGPTVAAAKVAFASVALFYTEENQSF